MPIEDELQKVLNAAAPNTPWILINGGLVRAAQAEIIRLRKDLADERAMNPRRGEAFGL
jgi:hypothetical protein